MNRKTYITTAGSLPYLEAGELMRASHEELVAAGLPPACHRVMAAVWVLTIARSKQYDTVFVSVLVEMTGLDDRAVRRAIKRLVEAELLIWKPPAPGRRRTPSLIGIPSGA